MAATKGPAAAAKTILLAEDDLAIARMYQIKLASGGFTVVVCGSGLEAYQQIVALRPDLVILDLSLPEMSGFEVIKALQAKPKAFPIRRIVVLTNSPSLADRKRAAALGMDYLTKAEMTPRSVLEYVREKLGLTDEHLA